MDNTDSIDRLFEELTLNHERIEVSTLPVFWRGSVDFWHYWCNSSTAIQYKDEEYRLHRVYGPAYINEKYDMELWFDHGKLHRIDGGPAFRHKHNMVWYADHKLHRLDGPAVDILGNPKQYWINGQRLSPKEYKKEISRRIRKGIIK
jgi:hypothetical protein